MSAPSINIVTPAKWKVQGFWVWRRRHTFGLVAAVNPAFFAIGFEAITGDTKGIAIMVGPFWLGFATLPITPPQDDKHG